MASSEEEEGYKEVSMLSTRYRKKVLYSTSKDGKERKRSDVRLFLKPCSMKMASEIRQAGRRGIKKAAGETRRSYK